MEKENKAAEQKETNFTTELFRLLKRTIIFQWVIIVILIALIAGQGFYHIYKWSKYETVIVDSKDGGNASYIGNDGDVNNYGTGGSPQVEGEINQ